MEAGDAGSEQLSTGSGTARRADDEAAAHLLSDLAAEAPWAGRRPGQHVVHMHDLVDLEEEQRRAVEEHGAILLRVASTARRMQWSAARARHHPGGRAKPGRAYGTRDGLAAHRSLTFTCKRCGALVDLQTASRLARNAELRPGDGCSGRDCGAKFRPTAFAQRQRTMAEALEREPQCDGARVLVLAPERKDTRVLLLLPRRLALAAARMAAAGAAPMDGK